MGCPNNNETQAQCFDSHKIKQFKTMQNQAVLLICNFIFLVMSNAQQQKGVVGIYYHTWFQSPPRWNTNPSSSYMWGTPLGGPYSSLDESRIRLHAQWLECAGIDYILVDWTNNLYYSYPDRSRNDFYTIEYGTIRLFQVLKQIKSPLKVAIITGNAHNDIGALKKKTDFIWKTFIQSDLGSQYFRFKGKPLLINWIGGEGETTNQNPGWKASYDTRFTIRTMSAFLTQRRSVITQHRPRNAPQGFKVGLSPHWSWEDRDHTNYWSSEAEPLRQWPSHRVISVDPASIDLANPGKIPQQSSYEAMVITPACRGEPLYVCRDKTKPYTCPLAQGRQKGQFLKMRFEFAMEMRVPMVTLGTWNEWYAPNEQQDPEFSKDFEPSRERGFEELKRLKELIGRYKLVFGIRQLPKCDFQRP